MEAVIIIILKSFSNFRIYKYYTTISKPQLPKQREHKQTPFGLKEKLSINDAKSKIRFLEELFCFSNGNNSTQQVSSSWSQGKILQLTHFSQNQMLFTIESSCLALPASLCSPLTSALGSPLSTLLDTDSEFL